MHNQQTPLLRQIRASAGSGKTYELTSSFLSFLAQASNTSIEETQTSYYQYSWSGILAITFTNRAATEMKERVIHRLKDTALGLPNAIPNWTKQQASYWLTILLKNYSALNIRTIDSLLHMIIRLTALELHLPPDFQPIFSTQKALLPLLDALLEQTKYNKELYEILYETCTNVFFHHGYTKFMMGSMLRKTILSTIFPLMFNTTPLTTSKAIAEKLNTYTVNLKNYATELMYCIENEELLVHKTFLNFLEKCIHNPLNVLPPKSKMSQKSSLDDCLLQSNQATASQNIYNLYENMYASIDQLKTQGKLLKDALSIMPYVKLSQEVHKHLFSFFWKQKILPAELIPSLVQKAISGPYGVSGTFCKLGTNLRQILIDEFQDTSKEQWAAIHPLIIEALSQGGSLTWVGDVKQAIYGWRNGDTTLFDKITDDSTLKAIAPCPQIDMLPTNWRSSRIIVTTNNTIFNKLASQHTATTILSSLLPKNTPQEIKSLVLKDEVPILIKTFKDSGQSISPDKTEGYILIQHIKETSTSEIDILVQKKLVHIIQEVSSRRPLGDITILVRTNAKATQVAQWLMGIGIAVITENSFLLSEHPLITQLTALLQFLDTPKNDLAFWTIITGGTLLSSLIDLTQQQLNEWICTRNKSKKSQPLYIAFKHSFPSIWEQWLAPFHTRAGLLTPYDTIQEAIIYFEVHKRFPKEMPFVRRFLEVLHMANVQGFSSISSFLNHWEQYKHEEKTPMPEHLNAVRVMTIHKSKGLQFPVVIIPWHDFSTKPNEKFLQINVDGLEILTKSSKAIGKEYYKDYAKKAQESLHLLYVAWTRAEEELYPILTSTKKSTFSEAIRPLLEDYLTKDKDIYEAGKKSYSTNQQKLDATHSSKVHISSQNLPYASDLWKPMHWLPQLRIFRNPVHERSFTNKRRGILLHYCLQYLQLSGNSKHDATTAVKHGIKDFPLPLPTKQYTLIESEFIEMLTWYIELPQTPYWIKFGTPEQSLLDNNNNIYRVDLIVNDSKQCSIIEYKTGEPLAKHKKQIQHYMNLVQKSITLTVSGTIVYFDLKEIHTFNT